MGIKCTLGHKWKCWGVTTEYTTSYREFTNPHVVSFYECVRCGKRKITASNKSDAKNHAGIVAAEVKWIEFRVIPPHVARPSTDLEKLKSDMEKI